MILIAFTFFRFNCQYSFHQVCLEICNHLNIQLFRIPYPPNFANVSNTKSGATDNSQERNGTNSPTSFLGQSGGQPNSKRQTRSSKRNVVAH